MSLTEIPMIVMATALLGAVLGGLVDAIRRRRWAWIAVQLILPPIASVVYLVAARTAATDGPPGQR